MKRSVNAANNTLHRVSEILTRKRSVPCTEAYNRMISEERMGPSARQDNDNEYTGVILDSRDYKFQPK
jgi:hypothetical protein